jgi:hypothetical protein
VVQEVEEAPAVRLVPAAAPEVVGIFTSSLLLLRRLPAVALMKIRRARVKLGRGAVLERLVE